MSQQKEQKKFDTYEEFCEYYKDFYVCSRESFECGNRSVGSPKMKPQSENQKEQTPTECDKETDIQKAFREGQSVGRQEVFDNPGAYGLEKIDNVFGFRIGDMVRLIDGDGRSHIIKHFEKIEGLHGPNFYRVRFEDNTASDHIIPGDEYPNGYFTCIEKIDEQQEQKPIISAEESLGISQEEYNKIVDKCIYGEQKSIEDVVKYITKNKEAAIKFLKSAGIMDDNGELTEMYRSEQKPTEWSEEDKIHMNNAILAAEKEWGSDSCTSKWLKSLPERFNLQPKQEWSEEDERMVSWIRTALSTSAYITPRDTKIVKEWLENRLKLFRPQPHWKPSEEQMKVFLKATPVNLMPEELYVYNSLCNDIQKLM